MNKELIDSDELAELRKNAGRYLWLRESDPDAGLPTPLRHECNSWGTWYWLPVQGKALDDAIDEVSK